MLEHPVQPPSPRGINRRSFLKLSGLIGAGLASTPLLPVNADAVRFNRNLVKVSTTRPAMGTFVSMTLVDPSQGKAEDAVAAAFEEIERLSRLFNRFDSATAVAQLNQEGVLEDVPPEMARVVGEALRYYRISQGHFDITVKPVVDLYKETFSSGREKRPSRRALHEAAALVGARRVKVHGRAIRFEKPGMGITLDGIAKGHIVDRAARVLTSRGIANYLINAGGDIRTQGSRQDRKPWTVAVEDPRKQGHYPDIVRMNDGAIATSGNYEIYFDREKMFHHIVDPRTGMSPSLDVSVTVTAQRTLDADALSTAVFVMPPQDGIRFIDSLPGFECLVVKRGGSTLKSSGWNAQRA